MSYARIRSFFQFLLWTFNKFQLIVALEPNMLLAFRQFKNALHWQLLSVLCVLCCPKGVRVGHGQRFLFPTEMNAGECAREAIFDSDYPPRRAKLEPCVLCVDCDRTWRPLWLKLISLLNRRFHGNCPCSNEKHSAVCSAESAARRDRDNLMANFHIYQKRDSHSPVYVYGCALTREE